MNGILTTSRAYTIRLYGDHWFIRQISVLNKNRKPIGYLDVAALKEKWEAGKADPVRTLTHFARSS